MSLEIVIVFTLLVVAVVLFASERVSFDVSAILIMCTLMLTGILNAREGLSGFSNEATLTIGAMFVLSEGIYRTGALDIVGLWLTRLGERSELLALVVTMVVVGVISAFINNTAAVAIFIPIVLSVAADLKVSPSKLLMPVSFAAMFGGVCTLIGTSTNILVSSLAEGHGLPGFSMFEFAPVGIILLLVGFGYLLTFGRRLIPERRVESDLTETYRMGQFLTEVVLQPESEHVGKPLDADDFTGGLDLDVVEVFTEREESTGRDPSYQLRPGDVLRIRGGVHEIDKLLRREDVRVRPVRPWRDVDLSEGSETLVEAVIAPDSALEGKAISNVAFEDRFGAVLLAIRHHGRLQQEQMADVRLSGGDSILLSLPAERIQDVQHDPSFVVVSEVGVTRYRRSRMPIAIAILVAVVALSAFDVLPIVVSALTGAVLLLLTGCLTTEEAYQAVNWKVIMLLAGVLPLGLAMEKTGAANLIADTLLGLAGDYGAVTVLSAFFFISMMLTNIISNQATAALLVPVAFQCAEALDVSARPLLIAVTFAASLSFMTPVGYQTNTLIYGPGQYRFSDFTRVGAPLNLILWILATLLIPIFWSF